MHSHKVYVVASTEKLRDVHVDGIYDSDVYTVDSIVAGLKDKLKGQLYQVSMYDDNAYIDVVDSKDNLVTTYSIISKVVMLVND